MHTETFAFAGFGGVKLPAILWLPDGEPGRILQIAHGMTGHIGRYEALAEKLTAQGIAVAGYDLRGHGQNPGNPDVASFDEGAGKRRWRICIGSLRICLRAFLACRMICWAFRWVRSC